MLRKKVLVAGSLVLDIVAEVDGGADTGMMFAEGKQTELAGVTMYAGGEVGNLGLALHRLGVPTALCSKVGDDANGAVLRRLLQHSGAGANLCVVPGMASSVSVCLAVPGKDKITFHRRGASQTFRADDIPEDLLTQADLFHFGYPTTMESLYADGGAQLCGMLRRAKQAGATTAMDMSLPSLAGAAGQVNWRPILTRVLPYVDLFLPSLEECVFLWDRARYAALAAQTGSGDMIDRLSDEDARTLAGQILALGAKIVLLKCGKKGLYLRTASTLGTLGRAQPGDPAAWQARELWESPCQVPHIRSTTGAGDTAIAGFTAAFLHGCSPGQALQAASYTAARCIAGIDTSGSLGPLEQVLEACGRQPKLPAALSPALWQAGHTPGQWVGPLDQTRHSSQE